MERQRRRSGVEADELAAGGLHRIVEGEVPGRAPDRAAPLSLDVDEPHPVGLQPPEHDLGLLGGRRGQGPGTGHHGLRGRLQLQHPQGRVRTGRDHPGGGESPVAHDVDDPPNETYLEETYYHRLARPGGFAVQRVYTDDRSLDETMAVGDRDVVLVPRGYHPVGAPHGFDLWYLNVMAGPVRQWKFTMAPEHAFLTF